MNPAGPLYYDHEYRDSPPVADISAVKVSQSQPLDLPHEPANSSLIVAAGDERGGRSVDDEQPLNAKGGDQVIGAGLHDAVGRFNPGVQAANRVALLVPPPKFRPRLPAADIAPSEVGWEDE